MNKKINHVFFVTYNNDNTKSPLLSLDDTLTNEEKEKVIFEHLRNDPEINEKYTIKELENAAKTIVNNDFWQHNNEEYYLEEVTCFF